MTLKNLENRFLRRVHCSLIEKIMPFNIIVVDREILTMFRECFYGRAFLRRRLFMLLNPEEEGGGGTICPCKFSLRGKPRAFSSQREEIRFVPVCCRFLR